MLLQETIELVARSEAKQSLQLGCRELAFAVGFERKA